MIRHFTNSVYVYDFNTKKFLFINHKKLKKWLQPGGHLENDELPDEAAIREVFEETGLKVRLIGTRKPRETDQVCPYGIQINKIEDGIHEHMDFIYLATPENEVILRPDYNEINDIGWFSIQEILMPEFDTFEEQRYWCTFFYDLISERID